MEQKRLNVLMQQRMSEQNLTQERLAEMLNISTRQVNNIVRGKSDPSVRTFVKICAVLKIDINSVYID